MHAMFPLQVEFFGDSLLDVELLTWRLLAAISRKKKYLICKQPVSSRIHREKAFFYQNAKE